MLRDKDIERLSPLVHEHINLHGGYYFSLPEEVQRGEPSEIREMQFRNSNCPRDEAKTPGFRSIATRTPTHTFFQLLILQHCLSHRLLQGLVLLLQSTNLIRGRIPLGFPSQTILTRIQEGFGSLVVDRRLNPFFPAQFGDGDLASESLQHDSNLRFGGESPAGSPTDLFDDV